MNINPRLFPSLMIAMSILAALVYASHRDWKQTIYWVASATLIAAVTY